MRWSSLYAVTLSVLLASLCTSMLIQWARDTGRFDPFWQKSGPGAESADTGETTPVPSVLGLPSAVAAELLTGRGLVPVVCEERDVSDAHSSTVLYQVPPPGSHLKPGDRVGVVISPSGARQRVPDVIGLTSDAASKKLKAAGLTVGAVHGLLEGDVLQEVQSTKPMAASVTELGSPVDLYLGVGLAKVPTVVGLRVRKARAVLEEVGLKVGKVRVGFSDVHPEFAVIEQDPAAGDKVQLGTAVDLYRNEE